MRIGVLVFSLCGLPFPAAAGLMDFILRNPGCAQIATVQYLDCKVDQIFRCPSQGPFDGPLLREEVYVDGVLDHVAIGSRNGSTLVDLNVQSRFGMELDPATLQETTLEDAQADGTGSFGGDGMLTMFGMEKPFSAMTSVKIGGPGKLGGVQVLAVEAEIAVTLPQPMGLTRDTLRALLVPSLGIYIEGESTGGTFYRPDTTPHRPMSIALPGQPGFDVTKPDYCGGSLSLLDTGMFPDGVTS